MKFKEFFINESITDLIQSTDKLAYMSASEIEDLISNNMHSGKLERPDFTKSFSWSIPCKEAIDAIKEYARPPLYDLMAGTGFWAKILNQNGVKTYASDINVFKHNAWTKKQHMKIRRQNAIKGALAIDRARESQGWSGDVIISWPPYKCSTAGGTRNFANWNKSVLLGRRLWRMYWRLGNAQTI